MNDVPERQNESAIRQSIGSELTQRCSPDVPRDLLVKRNLAEQSKWLNDDTGDRSWAKHETQQMAWMIGEQRKTLARGN
jgi:hypothetical protein